jgi:ankyrin repeat protein
VNLSTEFNFFSYKQEEETALMIASRGGSFSLVQLLVENGADLMATNKVYAEIYNIVLVCVFNVAVMLILFYFSFNLNFQFCY